MLSRVADAIYWMSRYIERAESVARFVSVNLNLSLDLPAEPQWRPLVVTTGDQEPFDELYPQAERHSVISFLTFDRRNPNSIQSCLDAARENARSIREVISSDVWEQLNRFYHMVREVARQPLPDLEANDFYEHIRHAGQHFQGALDSTMTHGEPWHFATLGRMLERADNTSRILDVKYYILLPSVSEVGTPVDFVQWAALLRSASALGMYRQRYGSLDPQKVVSFLILDTDFPRAILYCLNHANDSLHAIAGTRTGTFANPAEKQLGQLRADLAYRRADEILTQGLHEFIDLTQRRLNAIGSAIHETFFALRPANALTGYR